MQNKENSITFDFNYFINKFSRLYFIIAVVLVAVAFFNPVAASLLVFTLLTGSIWVIVDSCGGLAASIDFLRNRNYKNEDDKNYTSKNIHLLNIVWCAVMLVAAIASLFFTGNALWLSLLFITFGCSMWIYVIDNMSKEDWQQQDKKELIRVDTVSFALGGLGAIFLAIYIGFGLPYAVGLIGVLCYLISAFLKLGQFLYEMSNKEIKPKIGHDESRPLLESENSYKPEAISRPDSLYVNDYPENNLPSFAKFARENTDLSNGFSVLLTFVYSFIKNIYVAEKNIKETAHSVKCAANTRGGFEPHLVESTMQKAAIKFKLDPIVISGGDTYSHMIAVRSALILGFTNITIAEPTNAQGQYQELLKLIKAIATNYNSHEDTLLELNLKGDVGVLHSHISRCLEPEQQMFLDKLMSQDFFLENARNFIQSN